MKCVVCSSRTPPSFLYASEDRMYGLPGRFEVRVCRSCGLLSLFPKPAGSRASAYYPASDYYSYVDDGKSIYRRLRNYLIQRFYHPTLLSKLIFLFINTVPAIPKLRKKGKLMDVGCGNGETLRSLKPHGWDIYGVDIDAHAVEKARQNGLTHVYHGNHTYLSRFPDGYFDVIRSYHVIEHIDNPKEFIDLSFKKLKKGGEFICGTPNSRSLPAKLFRSYWYNLDTPRHLYIFSPDNLRAFVEKSHLTVTDMQYCAGGGFLGSLQYILSGISGRRIRLINNPLLFFLFYPLDWLSDKMRLGDVFVLTARKK